VPKPDRPPGWDEGKKEGWDGDTPPGQEEDMALTIGIEGYGVVSDGQSITNYGCDAAGVSPEAEIDAYFVNAQAVSVGMGNKDGNFYYDIGSGNELDFSGGRTEEGEYIYIWYNVLSPGLLDTIANGGFRVRIGTGQASNFGEWDLHGSDTLDRYPGGWRCVVLDPTTTPTTVNGGASFDLSSIRYFGFYINMSGSAKYNNIIVQYIAVGKGLRITGTDAGTGWQEVADYCNDYTTRAWGMFQELQGVYYIYGNLYLGDTGQTAVTDLSDSGRIFKFADFEYYTSGASWASTLSSGFHGITVEDAVGFATTFEDGILVGTELGRSGSLFRGADDVDTSFDLYGGNNAASLTYLYGSSLVGIDGTINWGNDADHRCFSVSFEGCATFNPLGAVETKNCNFIDTLDDDDALLWDSNIDISDCSFIANAGGTVAAGIRFTAAGTYSMTDIQFDGNDYDIHSSIGAVVVDSYQPTEDGDVDLYSGSITRVAQQFTGTAGQLTRAIFSIRKQGSPTGDVYMKLYANSGGAPTGTALATSEAYNIADLTTSFADVGFEFKDEYTLAAATEYHISIEYTGGDSSNRLEVEYLTAGSGSETCNTYVSSWSSQTYDCRFQVNRDGYLKINATDSNPSTYRISSITKGAVRIVNTVQLDITVQDRVTKALLQDVQTSIYLLDAPYTELMNEDTTALGKAVEDYNYPGSPVDIVVKARKSEETDDPRYKGFSTTGQIGPSGFTLLINLEENPVLN